MGRNAYLFEAKGIQRYILASGRLRDAVGASELIDQLTRGDEALIRKVVQSATAKEKAAAMVGYSRCAAGCFCLHSDSKDLLSRIADVWRLVVSATRPGLEFSEGWGAGPDDVAALDRAYASLSRARENGGAGLPPAGAPVTLHANQTGLPAAEVFRYRNADGEDEFIADLLTQAQRSAADALKDQGVAVRFLAPAERQKYRFPRDLGIPHELSKESHQRRDARFPFLSGDQRVATIHADVSGLGQIFSRAAKHLEVPNGLLVLSNQIESAMEAAAQQASAVLIDHAQGEVLPARPVVLGGDDVVIIVRADLALSYVENLLKAIETGMAKVLKDHAGFPAKLTACAGVAITGASHPHLSASALADELCAFAKRKAKEGREHADYLSLAAFHVCTDPEIVNYRQVVLPALTVERTAGRESGAYRLTANPYAAGDPVGGFIGLSQLRALAGKVAAAGGIGHLLDLRKELLDGGRSAPEGWARWRKVAGRRSAVALAEVDLELSKCGIGQSVDLPFDPARRTPLFDALELLSLMPGGMQ